MNRVGWFFCGLAGAMLMSSWAFSPAAAAGKKPKPEARKKGAKKAGKKAAKKGPASKAPARPGRPSFEAMKAQLDLAPAQRKRLQPLWKRRRKALADWDITDQGEMLRQQRERLVLTPGPERAGIAAQVRALQAQRRGVENQHDLKIWGVLNPGQRAKWFGSLLYGYAVGQLGERDVHLTGEQAGKVRAVCNRIGHSMSAAPDVATMDRTRARVLREIYAEVLTGKQRGDARPDRKAKKSGHKDGHKKTGKSSRGRNGRRRRKGKGSKIKRLMKKGSNGGGGGQPGSGKAVAKPKTMGIGKSGASQLKPKGATATKSPGPKTMDLHRSASKKAKGR